MSIFPLPQFEADLEEYKKDLEAYEKLSIPKTLVVRFGSMKLVGEFPYDGTAKPGCGSKIVVRTHRGTELGEMLTSTCPNSGCSKSVSRQEMLQYIENSGGPDYPFFTDGRVLRIATVEDMNEQARIEGLRHSMVRFAQARAAEFMLDMKIIDAEPILGNERLTFYFGSEQRIDFRDLVHALSRQYATRIELRQIGARDEARLVADYEKCGQHCCCKQFLKVLKPVSIKSAKVQKATLDPLKISGRCGRLMCCLRYEDQTYDELNARLPKMKKRVGTPQGIGIVIDRQILTQLVLVLIEGDDGKAQAFPVEELMSVEEYEAKAAERAAERASDPLRGMSEEQVRQRTGGEQRGRGRGDARGAREGGGAAPGSAQPQRPPKPGEPRPREGGDRQERYRQRSQQEGRRPQGGPPRDSGPAQRAKPAGQEDDPSRSAGPPSERPPKPRGPVDLAERAKQRKQQEQQRRERGGPRDERRGGGAKPDGGGRPPGAPMPPPTGGADEPPPRSEDDGPDGLPGQPNQSGEGGARGGRRRRRRRSGGGRGPRPEGSSDDGPPPTGGGGE